MYAIFNVYANKVRLEKDELNSLSEFVIPLLKRVQYVFIFTID